MPQGDTYPRLHSNDGFAVTDEETRIMARMARNFVTIQRSLSEEHRGTGLIDKKTVNQQDLMNVLVQAAMHGPPTADPWPVKIRDDFTEMFARFAEWAERSGGFAIH